MAYQSLYRRYRPRRFSEIRGQSHVVTALRNAVRNSSVSHAYLFSGPRGTGKTSTARILAKALNCQNLQDGEPCCECESCVDMEAGRSFDLFELDAASNNGVDAIRDLVDRAAVGSPGRTKVYILDEVHMLSTAASNALLKTLEEPPGHVRFVLATTDPQKVLPTIKSRTQHYEFQLLSAAELEEYVRWIIADADLSVDDEAVRWAVRQGKGSARDTLSALDQVVAAGGVVERVEPVDALLVAIGDSDPGAAVQAVADALNLGHDPRVLGRALLDSLRDLFLLSLDAPVPHLVPEDLARLSEWATKLGTPLLTRAMDQVGTSLVEMRNAADPRIPLEVALIRLTRADADSVDGLLARIEKLETAIANGAVSGGAAAGGSGAGAPAAGPSGSGRGETARGGGSRGASARQESRGERTAPPAPPTPPVPPGAASQASSAPPVPPSAGAGSTAPPVPPSASPSSAPEVPSSPAPGSVASAAAAAPAAAGSDAPVEPAPPASEPAPPASAPAPAASTDDSTAAAAGPGLSVDALNAALTEKVLPSMKGVAKAIFSQGRFIAAEGDVGVYLVENAPTRDRAEKARPKVEELLTGALGRATSIRVVDSADSAGPAGSAGSPGRAPSPPEEREPSDDGGPGSNRPPGTPRHTAVVDHPSPPGPPRRTVNANDDDDLLDDELVMDLSELEDATDVATTGLERLLEAFPGAKVIEKETEIG